MLRVLGGTNITTSATGSKITINAEDDTALSFRGDSGSAKAAKGIIRFLGGTNATTSASGNTVTMKVDGAVPSSFKGDTGTAMASSGILRILGGTGVSTAATGNKLTITSSGDVSATFVADEGSARPVNNSLKVLGGEHVNTVGSGDQLTINAAGSLPGTFETDSGNASPAEGVLKVLGGTSVSTEGSGNTVTVKADGSLPSSFEADEGTATPADNVIKILGGDNISTSATENKVTVTNSIPYEAVVEYDLTTRTGDEALRIGSASSANPTFVDLTYTWSGLGVIRLAKVGGMYHIQGLVDFKLSEVPSGLGLLVIANWPVPVIPDIGRSWDEDMVMQTQYLLQRTPEKIEGLGYLSFHIVPSAIFIQGLDVTDGISFGLTSPQPKATSKFVFGHMVLNEMPWIETPSNDAASTNRYLIGFSARSIIVPPA